MLRNWLGFSRCRKNLANKNKLKENTHPNIGKMGQWSGQFRDVALLVLESLERDKQKLKGSTGSTQIVSAQVASCRFGGEEDSNSLQNVQNLSS